MNYKGWIISYFPVGSQHWYAERLGITMCANSKELLKTMIDLRRSETPSYFVR